MCFGALYVQQFLGVSDWYTGYYAHFYPHRFDRFGAWFSRAAPVVERAEERVGGVEGGAAGRGRAVGSEELHEIRAHADERGADVNVAGVAGEISGDDAVFDGERAHVLADAAAVEKPAVPRDGAVSNVERGAVGGA